MKTTVEVVAYTYRAGNHFTGVKLLTGRELRANDILRVNEKGTRWTVKGLGTLSVAAHQSGIRPIILVPEGEADRLAEGAILTIEE